MKIITRAEWGARHGDGPDRSNQLPWSEVVIHTEAGAVRDEDWPAITDAAKVLNLTERQHMQAIERYHAVTRGWDGIGYSFVIHRDGTICEGRGWGQGGSHTQTRNSTAAGVCFTGHGDLQPATEAQWGAAWWLIGEGIRLGKLTPRPKVTGHRNYARKSCPGNLIYPQLHRLQNITGNPRPTPTPDPGDDDMFTDADRKMLQTVHEQLTVSRDDKAKAGPTVRWMLAKANERIVRLLTKG